VKEVSSQKEVLEVYYAEKQKKYEENHEDQLREYKLAELNHQAE